MEADPLKSFINSCKITFLYCLPAIIAIMVLMGSYYLRVNKVADYIDAQLKQVEHALNDVMSDYSLDDPDYTEKIAEKLPQHKFIKNILEDPKTSDQMKQLIHYYANRRFEHLFVDSKTYSEKSRVVIDREVRKIWFNNAMLISLMAILPFLLLGSHLGFSVKLQASFSLRFAVVNQSWWMKFLLGFLLAYGWTYVLNPSGRGVGTIEQYLIVVDLSQNETLPIFIRDMQIKPIIAGFLGWYLYLLTYFFSKLTTHDVISTKPYGLMFQKFLFTYGIAVILPSIQSVANGGGLQSETGYNITNLLAFLTGYFPMSAFSLLKDAGLKMMHGAKEEKGQLQELPGISRWQILRLEEEGINSMGTLAYCCHEELRKTIPSMSNLIDYWVDIARLYTVLGQENYQKVKKHSRTASDFIIQAKEQDFVDSLVAENIVNTRETARILERMFPDTLSYIKNVS